MTKAVSILLLAGLAAFGQAPTDVFEKAPPGVEEALRARVNAFYQTWVDGKFRAGEKYVLESQLDTYYEISKQKFEKCDILRIKFENDFKEALVTIACKGKMNVQGEMLDASIAHTAFWAIDKDQWYWTIKPVRSAPSPFGEMHFDPNYAGVKGAGELFNPETGLPKDPKAVTQLGKGIINLISVDKEEVLLKGYEKSSAVITVSNGLTGEVEVRASVDGAPIGLKSEWDKTRIPAHGEAHLTLSYDPGDQKAPKAFARLFITVEQTNKTFPVRITFAIPPELEREIQRLKTGK